MNPIKAVDWLNLKKWHDTSLEQRLELILEVQANLQTHWQALADADCAMKGLDPNDKDNAHQVAVALQATVIPLASNLSACIEIYKKLINGKLPEPVSIREVAGNRYDIQVFPVERKDKMLYGDRKDFLRVIGQPEQKHPLEKDGGIIAVLGAGNYGSSFEMIRALFIDNSVVVHKAHHLNAASDKIWEEILQPLIDHHALSFCDPDKGAELTKDERIHKIYFTGGAETAKIISRNSQAELISECGGNNPCLIVPGDQAWTDKEIEHHAIQLATFSKLNGGAVCGRAQTLVLSRNWPQRQQFIDALEKALREQTPGSTTYYPGTLDVFERFASQYPSAKRIRPENGAIKNSDVLLIENAEQDGFATQNEAFCQVVSEVALDTPNEAAEFLELAVPFCNKNLLGSLGACILIDDETQKKHQASLDKAITELRYGGIAVNAMPPIVFSNPYLTWGGNEDNDVLVSGHGNFGNLFGYENVEKSIVTSAFMSPGHMLLTNKSAFLSMSKEATKYAISPSWKKIGCMTTAVMAGKFKRKDF